LAILDKNSNPVIITGGAQRLGLAIAQHLNRNGYKVLVTYRTHRDSLSDLHAQGIDSMQADFSSASSVTAFCHEISQRFSSVRALIHNASEWLAESEESDPAVLFAQMMQIHASAPYQINLALQPLLLASPEFSDIIHMTDYLQDKGSRKHIAYAASKAALHNLTLSFSAMLAPKVKVNSLAPSLLMFNDDDTEAYRQKTLKKSLLQICPGAQEAAKAVAYLLDSEYITGRTVHLDGGRHLA